MTDDDLFSDPEWLDFVEHARRDSIAKIAGSAAMISIAPGNDDLDVRFCMELGAAIMLNKPLLILQMPGRDLPPKLRAIADEIVIADIDTEEGRDLVAEAIRRVVPE